MFPQSTRILIIDDIRSLRDLLKAYLHRLGYTEITEAIDGDQGLNALWSAYNEQTPFELVISDWNMPNMTGIELLQRVRAVPEWKDLPFLILTTESEKARVVEAIQAHVSNYMVKPIDESMLWEKLEKIWAKKQKFDNTGTP
jgi:two-component system, chemotaxis family, chemotaxis protein CheY